MKSYIWALPTRLFHWSLVILTLGAWLLSEAENLLDYHAALGYGVGGLLLFRWIWGVVGPRYSRFADWPLSKRDLRDFFLSFSRRDTWAGHNPAASWVMLSILLVGTLVVLSGLLAYGIQEGKGPLAQLNHSVFSKMELFAEAHESLTGIWLFLILLHLAGVFSDYFLHPERRTILSMIDGYKGVEAPPARLHPLQALFAYIMLALALSLPLWAVVDKGSILVQTAHPNVDYDKEAPLFSQECASCHTLYPPHLLPQTSWERIMATLEDHFGDDASLDEEDRQKILRFLSENSAEHSSREAAHYLASSIERSGKSDIIAITQTPYWKEKHREIATEIFDAHPVRSKANCKACHRGIEKGSLADNEIRLPEPERSPR
ncbi:cytochrome b/b6 domain-containing protein [Nitratifractor sp.]